MAAEVEWAGSSWRWNHGTGFRRNLALVPTIAPLRVGASTTSNPVVGLPPL